jgi:hypothetical protein
MHFDVHVSEAGAAAFLAIVHDVWTRMPTADQSELVAFWSAPLPYLPALNLIVILESTKGAKDRGFRINDGDGWLCDRRGRRLLFDVKALMGIDAGFAAGCVANAFATCLYLSRVPDGPRPTVETITQEADGIMLGWGYQLLV